MLPRMLHWRRKPTDAAVSCARLRLVASTVIMMAVLCAPAVAAAAPSVPATVAPPASKNATPPAELGQWALDFTLPTFGKSGCLVCHSDPKLVVPKQGTDVSYWVDEAAYNKSVHARVICTGCHTDFGFKAPHDRSDWKDTAKRSCGACHEEQAKNLADGAHAIRVTPGKKTDPKAANKPSCGDCHGGHDMQKLKDNPAGQAAIHAQGQQMCGREECHKDYWDNFNDYYHGRAYKRGAEDAPACWDCHGYHTVLESKLLIAPTNVSNIPQTCGKGANGGLSCHEGSTEALTSYVKLIHTKDDVLKANFVYSIFTTVRAWFQ